jgi:hypothetical protein
MDRSEEDDVELGSVLPPRVAAYGEPARFAQGAPLRFPDFDLTYVRTEIDAPYRTWVFRVSEGTKQFDVRCHTGGVRESVRFNASNRPYTLELTQLDSRSGSFELKVSEGTAV